jgi:F-type H+-transporting ATPase subunit epsilon
MSKALHVTIASIAETLYDGEVDVLMVPGLAGDMAILANHEPLITTLKKGVVKVKKGTETTSFELSGGVLEISNNTASVLL